MAIFNSEKAQKWIDEMCAALGTDDEARASIALRAGMHAVRDRLSAEEAVLLGAQLPPEIRKLFFEDWQVGGISEPRTLHSFLEAVEHRLPHASMAPEDVARATFRLLEGHLPQARLANVRVALPRHVAELWLREPEPWAIRH